MASKSGVLSAVEPPFVSTGLGCRATFKDMPDTLECFRTEMHQAVDHISSRIDQLESNLTKWIALYRSEVRDCVTEFRGGWDLEVDVVHTQKRNSLFCHDVMGCANVGHLVNLSSDVSMRRQLIQTVEPHRTTSLDAEWKPFMGDAELLSTLRPTHNTTVTERDFVAIRQNEPPSVNFNVDIERVQKRVDELEQQFATIQLSDPGTTLNDLRVRLERLRPSPGLPVAPEDQLSRVETAQITLHLAMLLQRFTEHEMTLSSVILERKTPAVDVIEVSI
mmetsp:Transcript_27090/g.71272  ORF Transcript_27090/g.71272 Transcript_27090/m.71272 type:complete len:277 (-) Transcript_27090:178-1008(-)|eukprot:CAMPEP_0194530936 /NCGR_PEP_ID=MMETSP0253-20130528/68067_1 /TAXON_ID=2966 /ORGANISM="Noctiluca scintillans" /LENGTH=276 /DNA_ID=CAMNT_0039376239 /DNA_START=37 /DNA_END=867 /DNA_ORIENTATION=+